MQIPIDGSIESFGESLSLKDFNKSSLSDKSYHGYFYKTFASVEISEDKTNQKINAVKVRYNESMTKLSRQSLINLYRNIVQDYIAKYKPIKSAKCEIVDDNFLVTLPEGYICCRIFDTIFGAMGGGVNIEIDYVDKANSSDYKIPTFKRASDNL